MSVVSKIQNIFAVDTSEADKLNRGIVDAIERSQGVVHFDTTGRVVYANDIFLNLMSWTLEELRGQHYSVLVGQEAANSTEFRNFWTAVANGEARSGKFKRYSRDGRELWVQSR